MTGYALGEPWTGDDGAHNAAAHERWLRARHRRTAAPDYREQWYDAQCGGCAYWIALSGALGADWGACTGAGSPFDGRVRFEHDGCEAFAERGDSSFG